MGMVNFNMFIINTNIKKSFNDIFLSIFVFSQICGVVPQFALAQNAFNLPAPGTMVNLTEPYSPAIVMGINIYPENPLKFDFIIDQGDFNPKGDAFNQESNKLIKYFLASLTIPEDEMWVNLSPYEKDRIIPEAFGKTEMGRDLLALDYMLKQLSSSLMNPDQPLGHSFWNKVYAEIYKFYKDYPDTCQDQGRDPDCNVGADIHVDTFNKIWIVPENATIYQHEKGALILDTHLKVMLEEDYLALEANQNSTKHGLGNLEKKDLEIISDVAKEIIKEILIPEIEKEVNTGATFAPLRQIYNSMLLASWYKKTLKKSLLGEVYIDKKRTQGIDILDENENLAIYDQYIHAFQSGVFNLIKEDYDLATQEIVSRKYFSGGVKLSGDQSVLGKNEMVLNPIIQKKLLEIGMQPGDKAMITFQLKSVSKLIDGIKQLKLATGQKKIDSFLDKALSEIGINVEVLKKRVEQIKATHSHDPEEYLEEIRTQVLSPSLIEKLYWIEAREQLYMQYGRMIFDLMRPLTNEMSIEITKLIAAGESEIANQWMDKILTGCNIHMSVTDLVLKRLGLDLLIVNSKGHASNAIIKDDFVLILDPSASQMSKVFYFQDYLEQTGKYWKLKEGKKEDFFDRIFPLSDEYKPFYRESMSFLSGEQLWLSPFFLNLSIVYSEMGKTKPAFESCKTAIKFNSLNAEAHKHLGNIHFKEQNFLTAVENYSEAAQIDPSDYDAWFNLGEAYENIGNNAKAIESYLEVVKRNPSDDEAWQKLGHLDKKYLDRLLFSKGHKGRVDFRESLTVEEVKQLTPADFSKENYPYVMMLYGEGRQERWQLLEDKDPEGVPLSDYRVDEIKSISAMLSKYPLSAFIGPSRADKTETLFPGVSEAVSFDMATFGIRPHQTEEEVSKKFEAFVKRGGLSHSSNNKIILDEFQCDNPGHLKLLKILLKNKNHVMIVFAGQSANDFKKSVLLESLKEFNFSAEHIMEIGLKPLNQGQIIDFLAQAFTAMDVLLNDRLMNNIRKVAEVSQWLPLTQMMLRTGSFYQSFLERDVLIEEIYAEFKANLMESLSGRVISLDAIQSPSDKFNNLAVFDKKHLDLPESNDTSMLTKGGIDLNASIAHITIEREANLGDKQLFASIGVVDRDIAGFVPEIITVDPVLNILELIGIK